MPAPSSTSAARLVAIVAGLVGIVLCGLSPLLPVTQTTATITCGVTTTPSLPIKMTASRVAVSGSRSIAQLIAPMPMAIAGARSMPGSPLAPMPTAPPMNRAGKTGPPRKALSDKP